MDPFNPLMHSRREKVYLHDMVRDPSKRGLGKCSPTSHIEEFIFPPSHLECMLSSRKLKSEDLGVE